MYFWQASSICTVDRHRVAFPALIGKGGGRNGLGSLCEAGGFHHLDVVRAAEIPVGPPGPVS